MGRNDARQTTKLPFNGKPVELYRPTDSQATVIFLASKGKGDGSKAVVRFFQVIEALVVKPADWTRMEEAMVSGDVQVKHFSDLIENLFSYDWPEEAPVNAG